MEKPSLVFTLDAVKRVCGEYEIGGVENVWKKRGSLVQDPTAKIFFVGIAAEIHGTAHC